MNERNYLNESPEDIEKRILDAEKETDIHPTEKEIKAGNYRKGKVNINGFRIAIEQPTGSVRSGTDKNGKRWSVTMNNTYGYFLTTTHGQNPGKGQDGDEIDVFLGNRYDSKKIFVIDQFLDGKFDESKVFLLADTAEEARDEYYKNYSPGWKGCRYVTETDEDTFKEWLYDGKHQKKPFHDYIAIKYSLKEEDGKNKKTFNIKNTGVWLDEFIEKIKKYDCPFEIDFDEGVLSKQYPPVRDFKCKLIKSLSTGKYKYLERDGYYEITSDSQETAETLKDILTNLGNIGNCGHSFTCHIKAVKGRKNDILEFDGDGHDSIHITEGTKDRILKENLETEVNASQINLKSFDEKPELNPRLFPDGERLVKKVRMKMLSIADDFIKFLDVPFAEHRDILLVGSSAGYAYSKYSDIDIHVVYDFNEIDGRTDFVRNYFDAKKYEWNESHKGLKIYGMEVEMYVEDKKIPSHSNAVYSLEQNRWLKKPSRENEDVIDREFIKNKSSKLMTVIDSMYDVMENTEDEAVLFGLSADASRLWTKIRGMRKEGLERNGEKSPMNIIYKVLRRAGYLQKLYELKQKLYTYRNSIR